MHTHFLLFMLNTLNITFISLFTSVFLLHYMDRKISNPSQAVQKQSLLAVVKGGCQGAAILASRDVITPGSVWEVWKSSVAEMTSPPLQFFLFCNRVCFFICLFSLEYQEQASPVPNTSIQGSCQLNVCRVGNWTVHTVSLSQCRQVISGHFTLKAIILRILCDSGEMKPAMSLVFQTGEGCGNIHGNQFYYNTKIILIASSFCQYNIKNCDTEMQVSRYWTS